MTIEIDPPPAAPGDDASVLTGRGRWWALAVVAVGITFVVMVTRSAPEATVPVGASATMAPGMTMAAGSRDRVALRARDVDGRSITLPGGRPGAVMFVQARRCATCVSAARDLRRAIDRSGGAMTMTVVSADSATSRADVAAFARAAGAPRARYLIDDRNGSLSGAIRASSLGRPLVYDAAGRIIARPTSLRGKVERALRRVGDERRPAR